MISDRGTECRFGGLWRSRTEAGSRATELSCLPAGWPRLLLPSQYAFVGRADAVATDHGAGVIVGMQTHGSAASSCTDLHILVGPQLLPADAVSCSSLRPCPSSTRLQAVLAGG